MNSGRPRRPAAEARLVREAVQGLDPAAPREPIARDLAARVVVHLRAFAAEASNPVSALVGELGRAVIHSPALTLATDPDIDTLSLFTEARVKSLRDRNGWPRTAEQEAQDVDAAFACVERKLSRRYLDILRA